MKKNILIHSINGIGLGHIKRTVLIARELLKENNIGKIIFVTNSSDPFLILNEGFEVRKLNYGIEDTVKNIDFIEYEKNNLEKINKIISDNNIDIIIHDTYFIKLLVKNRSDLIHFLILRNSELNYLNQIKTLLYRFRKVYIPHMKSELSSIKLEFYTYFKNILFINYITHNFYIKNGKKLKKIIVSPGYGGDYENTLFFLGYINNLLKINYFLLNDYEIVFLIGKHFNKIKDEINFIKGSQVKKFYNNLNNQMQNCEIFIGRGGYNTLNEVIINNCKALLFSVNRYAENQEGRIEFFIKEFTLRNIMRGCFNVYYDGINLRSILRWNYKIKEIPNYFNGLSNFIKDFKKEINKKNILIYKSIFLPKSENFINEEIISFESINPIIYFLKKENINYFKINNQLIYFKEFNNLLNFGYPKIFNKHLYIKFIKYFIYLLDRFQIKIIYTEFLFDAYFIYYIKNIRKDIKIISAGRGYDVYSFLKNINYKCFLNKIDLILARDTIMLKEIQRYGVKINKLKVVRSVINLKRYVFKKKKFKKFDILIGGRFIEKKNILNLLDLIYYLINENIVRKVGLIGDGEQKELIINKINILGLNKKIRYLGFLKHENFISILNEYNCYISYSKIALNGDCDGVNNLIIENLLVGNLVFATNIGGISDILENKKTGFVLEGNIKKDVYIIKESLKYLRDSNITINGSNKVKKIFDKNNSINKLENIIKSYV